MTDFVTQDQWREIQARLDMLKLVQQQQGHELQQHGHQLQYMGKQLQYAADVTSARFDSMETKQDATTMQLTALKEAVLEVLEMLNKHAPKN